MKFKVIDAIDETEVVVEKGWELCRTAFDRGNWSILLVNQENENKVKTPVVAPRQQRSDTEF